MRHTGRSFTDFCKDITKFLKDDPTDIAKVAKDVTLSSKDSVQSQNFYVCVTIPTSR